MIVLTRKKLIIFAFFVFIIFFSTYPGYSESERKGLEMIKLGEKLFKENKYEAAHLKFLEAQSYIYNNDTRLRLYKNLSLSHYALDDETESRHFIMEILAIDLEFKLKDETAPRYKSLFLGIQSRLKKLITEAKSLIAKKFFSEAKKMLENSKDFKSHKKVIELKDSINKPKEKDSHELHPDGEDTKSAAFSKPKFVFFADIALGRIKSSLLTEYRWVNFTNLADVNEDFRISLNAKNYLDEDENISNIRAIPGIGFIKYSRMGAGLMVSTSFIQNSIEFDSHYHFQWQWLSGPEAGGTYNVTKNWKETGKLTVIPININLILGGKIGPKNTKLLVFGGPTIFYTRLYLKSRIGIGFILDNYTADWVALEFEIDKKELLLGANFGVGLEIVLNKHFGLYFDWQYLYFPEKTYTWELIPKVYYGEIEHTELTDAHEWDIFKNIKCEIDHYFLKINLGLRYYF